MLFILDEDAIFSLLNLLSIYALLWRKLLPNLLFQFRLIYAIYHVERRAFTPQGLEGWRGSATVKPYMLEPLSVRELVHCTGRSHFGLVT